MSGNAVLLALDVGTTHCKAALFGLDGTRLDSVSAASPARRSQAGFTYYDPEELWQSASGALRQVMEGSSAQGKQPAALGVASMAETALLLQLSSGRQLSPFLAWFDRSAANQAKRLAALPEASELFVKRGIYPNFKCGVAKLLWLKEEGLVPGRDAAWLSAADYVVYRLTGVLATDYSLACRTYALDLDSKTWDGDWLHSLGLSVDLFPRLLPAGVPAGEANGEGARSAGVPEGLPVAIAGHDHVCGALSVSAVDPGPVFNSMGTAESLLGAFGERPLGDLERQSGLVYGLHVIPDRRYWLGGISASGGSVEWLRTLLGERPLTYEQVEALLNQAPEGPSGILYFPYLAGSGSPHTDQFVRGAFVGLDANHGRPQFAKAVLEGTAYELEYIRRTAEQAAGQKLEVLLSAGGGTRSQQWMQIKADVMGCTIEVQAMPETTLLGAALLAGVGIGVYPDHRGALASLLRSPSTIYEPDFKRHTAYRRLYEHGYLALQEALRTLDLTGDSHTGAKR